MKKKLEQIQKNNELWDLENHEMKHDNILVEAITREDQDGVVTPTQYDDKGDWGIVLGVGPGRMLECGERAPVSVRTGDFITFGKYSSYKTRQNGRDLLVIRDEDIMSSIKV
jgi:chaperonin GroES